MTTTLRLFVPGTPAPQGSKSFKGFRNGRGIMVESSKAVGPWRERVALAAHNLTMPADVPTPIAGQPLAIRIDFVMPRPASAPKRRTPAAIRRPDGDKLARAVLDALTGIWFADDAAIVDLRATKRLAEIGETPGAHIALEVMQP